MQLQFDRAGVEVPNLHKGRPVSRVFSDEAKGVARLDFEAIDEVEAIGARADSDAVLKAQIAALEEQLRQQAEAIPGKLDEAKRLARLLARKEWQQEMEQRTAEDRAMVLRACEEFAKERTRYFAAVEAQVVRLALAIAARVLQREARMDPLLLSGAVRVALEKVDEESETRLRVPMSDVEMWNEEFETTGDGAVRVVGDEGMARGECMLETSVGTVDLGVEAQLGEIERGFFDLMQRRPA
jgi:flagellar assembly protein FliH